VYITHRGNLIYFYLSFYIYVLFNPINAKLNPICHLLTLLGAHHILHVRRIWVKAAVCNCMRRKVRWQVSGAVASHDSKWSGPNMAWAVVCRY